MALRPIFKDGEHKTPHPKKVWTADDVGAVFTNSQSLSPDRLPMVVGHPRNDLPVIGYLARKSLQMMDEGDRKVIMVDDEMDAVFSAEAIEQARKAGYDKISVRIKMPEMYIRSIGLVPEAAVDELNDATFADGEEPDEAFAVFEADAFFGTNEYRVPWIGGLFRRLRDAWIERFGKDEADKVLPSYEIDSLMDAPSYDSANSDAEAASATFGTAKSFSTNNEGISTMTEQEKKELDQLRADKERLEGLVADQTKQTRQQAIDAVFGAPEYKGKITDKNKPELQKVAESLWPEDATFGADDDPLGPLKMVLDSMPVLVTEEEIATSETAADSATFGADGGSGDVRSAYRKQAKKEFASLKN